MVVITTIMGSRRRRPARKTVRCHLCRPARALNLRPTAAAASRLTSLGSLQSRRRSSRTGRPRAAAALGARGRSMTRSETGQPATGHPAVSRPDRTVEIKRRKRRASARPQGGSAEHQQDPCGTLFPVNGKNPRPPRKPTLSLLQKDLITPGPI